MTLFSTRKFDPYGNVEVNADSAHMIFSERAPPPLPLQHRLSKGGSEGSILEDGPVLSSRQLACFLVSPQSSSPDLFFQRCSTLPMNEK